VLRWKTHCLCIWSGFTCFNHMGFRNPFLCLHSTQQRKENTPYSLNKREVWIFIQWIQEEILLLGSSHYVQKDSDGNHTSGHLRLRSHNPSKYIHTI
jgi:hypothetical protein